jgi:hypothetical protein
VQTYELTDSNCVSHLLKVVLLNQVLFVKVGFLSVGGEHPWARSLFALVALFSCWCWQEIDQTHTELSLVPAGPAHITTIKSTSVQRRKGFFC